MTQQRDKLRETDRFGRKAFGGVLLILFSAIGLLIGTWATVVEKVDHIGKQLDGFQSQFVEFRTHIYEKDKHNETKKGE